MGRLPHARLPHRPKAVRGTRSQRPAHGADPIGNERTTHLYRVLGKVGAKAMYTYDFGDSWEHAIIVEKVLPPEPGLAYPVCVGGKLQGPPEDCGGIPGYYNLLEAIRDPTHEEHEDLLDWVGGEFNPEAFSVDDVNRRLQPLQRWWAKTSKQAAEAKTDAVIMGVRCAGMPWNVAVFGSTTHRVIQLGPCPVLAVHV